MKVEETFVGKYHLIRSLQKIATLSDFEKKSNFFWGKPICFSKQSKFCSFSEILLFQSHSRATVL